MFDPYHKWLGIPPKDQPPNHYRLIGIDLFESDADVIDASANKQMAYIQGCATGPHLALSQKLLNEIAAARLCLLSPAKKVDYDAKLKTSVPSAPLTKPILATAFVSSQQAAITASSPAPVSPKPPRDEPGLFEVVENEPDVKTLGRKRHRSKKLPVILGCVFLGVTCLVGVYGLGVLNPSTTDKRQAKDAKPLARPEMSKTDKKGAASSPEQLKSDKKVETAKSPEIHIFAVIDGSDTLYISEADGFWVHHSFIWHTSAKINGLDWNPKANPRFAQAGTSRLFPGKVDFLTAELSVKKGRGRVELKKEIDRIQILFDDHPAGSDTYEVVVSFGK